MLQFHVDHATRNEFLHPGCIVRLHDGAVGRVHSLQTVYNDYNERWVIVNVTTLTTSQTRLVPQQELTWISKNNHGVELYGDVTSEANQGPATTLSIAKENACREWVTVGSVVELADKTRGVVMGVQVADDEVKVRVKIFSTLLEVEVDQATLHWIEPGECEGKTAEEVRRFVDLKAAFPDLNYVWWLFTGCTETKQCEDAVLAACEQWREGTWPEKELDFAERERRWYALEAARKGLHDVLLEKEFDLGRTPEV